MLVSSTFSVCLVQLHLGGKQGKSINVVFRAYFDK